MGEGRVENDTVAMTEILRVAKVEGETCEAEGEKEGLKLGVAPAEVEAERLDVIVAVGVKANTETVIVSVA